MKITIDDKILSKYKLTKEQFFFMLSLVYKVNDNAIDSLLKKKFYISQSYGAGCVPQHNYFLAHAGVDIVNKILLESEHLGTNQKERLDNLAKTLQALYPEGKKAAPAAHRRAHHRRHRLGDHHCRSRLRPQNSREIRSSGSRPAPEIRSARPRAYHRPAPAHHLHHRHGRPDPRG